MLLLAKIGVVSHKEFDRCWGRRYSQPQLSEDVKSGFEGFSDNFDLMFVVKELPDERRDTLRQCMIVDYATQVLMTS